MNREELEAGARNILLSNLRKGVADWNGKEFSFVVPSLRGYPFQWFWDSCFHAIALTHLDLEQAKAELTTLMSGALPDGSFLTSYSGKWKNSPISSAATLWE